MSLPTRIAVLGAGAWGLALAHYVGRRGYNTVVWDRSKDVLDELRRSRTINRPQGLYVDESVFFADTLAEVCEAANIVLSVVPSYATRDICKALRDLKLTKRRCLFVNCSKGIEVDSLCLPSQIFAQIFNDSHGWSYGVLAGPSHAEEVSRDVPTAVVAAARDQDDGEIIQSVFNSPTFRVYRQSDVTGVELGGALKNVLAIAAGICDGKGFGDNAKAALITRGLAESSRLGAAMGAAPGTVSGLSGLGDLIVTSMSRHSRNRRFGEIIASGCGPQQALERVGAVVEGYKTSQSAYMLSEKHNVEMPLVKAVYQVLYQDLNIDEGIAMLLGRGATVEDLP